MSYVAHHPRSYLHYTLALVLVTLLAMLLAVVIRGHKPPVRVEGRGVGAPLIETSP